MRCVAVASEDRDWISLAGREAEKWARKVEARSVMRWEVVVVVVADEGPDEGGDGEWRRFKDMEVVALCWVIVMISLWWLSTVQAWSYLYESRDERGGVQCCLLLETSISSRDNSVVGKAVTCRRL